MNQQNNTIKTHSGDDLQGSPQNQMLFNHAKIIFLPITMSKDFFVFLWLRFMHDLILFQDISRLS